MNKKLTYTEVVIFITTLILFTNNHLLYAIMNGWTTANWFGITVNVILVDFVLYLAVALQIVGILILLEEKIKLYLEIKKKEIKEKLREEFIGRLQDLLERKESYGSKLESFILEEIEELEKRLMN